MRNKYQGLQGLTKFVSSAVYSFCDSSNKIILRDNSSAINNFNMTAVELKLFFIIENTLFRIIFKKQEILSKIVFRSMSYKKESIN